jgi:predicted nucleotidyltransferase
MRLTAEQTEVIRGAVREVYGEDSRLWLFGSRVDDERRGGDIDLLVRPNSVSGCYTLMDKIRLLGKLERGLGERKIDVIVETPDDQRPIVKIAHESGIQL